MTSVSTLYRDQRGMILIPAIAMVSILALGTLHITDTALGEMARIGAQTQADAEALEGAIWHAQGMNLLIMLNIIMACILAVFLAVRLVTMALLLVTVVLGIFSFAIPALAGALPSLVRGLDTMHRIEQKVAKPVMNALKTVSNTERVVAAAVPWVAAALPVSRLNGDPYGIVLSVSMIPDFEQVLKDFGQKKWQIDPKRPVVGGLSPRLQFPARMGNLYGIGSTDKPDRAPYQPGAHAVDKKRLIGKFIDKTMSTARKAGNKGAAVGNNKYVRVLDVISGSLPAQEEDYFQVCSRSGELLAALFTKVLLGPLHLSDGTVEPINSFFGKAVGNLPTVTCMPLDEIDNKILDEINSQVDASCAEQKRQYETTQPPADEQKPGQPRHRQRKWTVGMQKDCEKKEKEKANNAVGQNDPDDDKQKKVDYTKDRASPDEIKTAAIWGELRHPKESPLIHVWSVTLRPAFSFAPADSEAEFRHPCNGDTDTDNRSCGDNAMWRFGWYAKTVQLKSLPRELAAHVGDLAQGWVNRMIGKGIQGVVGRLFAGVPKSPNIPGNAKMRSVFGQPLNRGSPRHTASSPRHRAPDSTSVQDALLRHFQGVRNPQLGNAYWSRKYLNSVIGNKAPWLDGAHYPGVDDDLTLH